MQYAINSSGIAVKGANKILFCNEPSQYNIIVVYGGLLEINNLLRNWFTIHPK